MWIAGSKISQFGSPNKLIFYSVSFLISGVFVCARAFVSNSYIILDLELKLEWNKKLNKNNNDNRRKAFIIRIGQYRECTRTSNADRRPRFFLFIFSKLAEYHSRICMCVFSWNFYLVVYLILICITVIYLQFYSLPLSLSPFVEAIWHQKKPIYNFNHCVRNHLA